MPNGPRFQFLLQSYRTKDSRNFKWSSTSDLEVRFALRHSEKVSDRDLKIIGNKLMPFSVINRNFCQSVVVTTPRQKF